MDEAAARTWLISTFDVSRETLEKLEAFVALLKAENEQQNLISRSTVDWIWSRHIADSAQLLLHAGTGTTWVDLGTGAGFPGLIVALLQPGAVTLIEERAKRAEFLTRAAAVLKLTSVTILQRRAESLQPAPFDVISARAFAPLDRLLTLGERFATTNTRWVLPKGKNAKSELAEVQSSWQGDFRLEPSLTDDDAGIIVATGVQRRAKGNKTA